MIRRPPLLALLGAVLLAASPAWAGKGDAAGALIVIPPLAALAVYPLGLAVHLLLLATLPGRGRTLVAQARRPRTKGLVLGAINSAFLLFFAVAIAKPAPPLALLIVLVWLAVALIGSHGLARVVGAAALGRRAADGPPADVKDLAVGWFVLVFAAALPLVGWVLAAYWSVRAVGGVVLTLLVGPPPEDEASDL